MYDFGQTISLIIAMHIGTRMWNEEIFDERPSQAIRPRLAQLSAPSRTGFVAARNICCHNSAEQVPISSALNTHLLHLGFRNIQMQHFYRTQVWSLPALVKNWLPSWVTPVGVTWMVWLWLQKMPVLLSVCVFVKLLNIKQKIDLFCAEVFCMQNKEQGGWTTLGSFVFLWAFTSTPEVCCFPGDTFARHWVFGSLLTTFGLHLGLPVAGVAVCRRAILRLLTTGGPGPVSGPRGIVGGGRGPGNSHLFS